MSNSTKAASVWAIVAVAVITATVASGVSSWASRDAVSSNRTDVRTALAETKTLWERHYEQALAIARVEGELSALQRMVNTTHTEQVKLFESIALLKSELHKLRRPLDLGDG